jgi:hypothetical protein
MKWQLVPLFCVLAAGGCSRWVDIDSDAFDTSNVVSMERLALDDRACIAQAENARSYGIYGISEDNVGKRRIYNHAYTACMQAKGYKEREIGLDLSDSFDFF